MLRSKHMSLESIYVKCNADYCLIGGNIIDLNNFKSEFFKLTYKQYNLKIELEINSSLYIRRSFHQFHKLISDILP